MTGEVSPPPTVPSWVQAAILLLAGRTPALLGSEAFARSWLSQAVLDHCDNVGLIQRTFSSSLQKTLEHGSDPSLLLPSRALAGEREISVMGMPACTACTACCQQLLKLSQWSGTRWTGKISGFTPEPPNPLPAQSSMHNLAGIMSQLIILLWLAQLMKWPMVRAANSASCASCRLNVLAFTESSETSRGIYFSFLLALLWISSLLMFLSIFQFSLFCQ